MRKNKLPALVLSLAMTLALTTPASGGTADPTNDSLTADGQPQNKINGSNYFKLRDLGRALDFYVGWTAESDVYIETGRPYSE